MSWKIFCLMISMCLKTTSNWYVIPLTNACNNCVWKLKKFVKSIIIMKLIKTKKYAFLFILLGIVICVTQTIFCWMRVRMGIVILLWNKIFKLLLVSIQITVFWILMIVGEILKQVRKCNYWLDRQLGTRLLLRHV